MSAHEPTRYTWLLCNDRGSWADPRPLPSPIGGMMWNALDAGNDGNESTSWTDCASGDECDWYAVELDQGERLTATTNNTWSSYCNVELAVFAPEEQQYWNIGGGARTPALFDSYGSLEQYGAQLSFVVRRSGLHRLRARLRDSVACPRYQLAVAAGAMDAVPIPEIH